MLLLSRKAFVAMSTSPTSSFKPIASPKFYPMPISFLPTFSTQMLSLTTPFLSGCCKSGFATDGLNVFATIPRTDRQSWNIVISGFVEDQMVEEALAHFVKLRSSFVGPDSFTYPIIVPSCDMVLGQQFHADVVKICSVPDVFLGTNLIRVYAGVGEMDAAMKVLGEISKRNLVAWNALISCYSKANMGERSTRLFQQLGKEGSS